MAAHNGARAPLTQVEADGRWQEGQSGCPTGRPKGARNKLSDAFLQALADDFEANGKLVIERVRSERPHDYLKVCASVMPKRLENEDVSPARYVLRALQPIETAEEWERKYSQYGPAVQ